MYAYCVHSKYILILQDETFASMLEVSNFHVLEFAVGHVFSRTTVPSDFAGMYVRTDMCTFSDDLQFAKTTSIKPHKM